MTERRWRVIWTEVAVRDLEDIGHLLERAQVVLGCVPESRGREHDRHVAAAVREMPRGAETASAVVAAAREDDDLACRRDVTDHFGQGRARMLHHLQEVDPEDVHSEAVRFRHLLDREPGHGPGVPRREAAGGLLAGAARR